MNKLIAGLLAVILLLSSVHTSFASASAPDIDKDETVYFMLDAIGTSQRAIVVNTLHATASEFVDCGSYDATQNLSAGNEPTIQGDQIRFTGLREGERFYYRGELRQAVSPWQIRIYYSLDGRNVEPQQLPTAKGRLRMEIEINPNSQDPSNFASQYALQISSVIHSPLQSVETEGLRLVAVGSTQHIAGIAIPQLSERLVLEADVDGFEMDALTFTGIRAELDRSLDLTAVTEGVQSMDTGASSVLGGLIRLQSGVGSAVDGIGQVVVALDRLAAGGEQLEIGAGAIAAGVKILKQSGEELTTATKAFFEATIPDREQQLQLAQTAQLAQQLTQSPDPQVALLAVAYLKQLEGQAMLSEGAKKLANAQEEYVKGVVDGLDAVDRLMIGTKPLIDGIRGVRDGVRSSNEQFVGLKQGVSDLVAGQMQMVEGVGSAKARIDALLAAFGHDPKRVVYSFVAQDRTVRSVQFILRTPEIKRPAPKIEPAPPKERNSLWNRIKNLFRK